MLGLPLLSPPVRPLSIAINIATYGRPTGLFACEGGELAALWTAVDTRPIPLHCLPQDGHHRGSCCREWSKLPSG
jgi:hypothetical protein